MVLIEMSIQKQFKINNNTIWSYVYYLNSA